MFDGCRWSNIHRPGQWIFQVGPIPEGQNVLVPDNVDGNNKLNGRHHIVLLFFSGFLYAIRTESITVTMMSPSIVKN